MKDWTKAKHHWIEVENILEELSKSKDSGIVKGGGDIGSRGGYGVDGGDPVFVSSSRMKHLASCWLKRSKEIQRQLSIHASISNGFCD